MSSITKKELYEIALSRDPDQEDTQYTGNIEITISPDLKAETTMSTTAPDGWQLNYEMAEPEFSPLLCDGQYMTASGDIVGFEAMPVDEIIGMLKSGEIQYLTIEIYYE